jgi:hypothetical protein
MTSATLYLTFALKYVLLIFLLKGSDPLPNLPEETHTILYPELKEKCCGFEV